MRSGLQSSGPAKRGTFAGKSDLRRMKGLLMNRPFKDSGIHTNPQATMKFVQMWTYKSYSVEKRIGKIWKLMPLLALISRISNTLVCQH